MAVRNSFTVFAVGVVFLVFFQLGSQSMATVSVLHHFGDAETAGGSSPHGHLIQDGSVLYGMTESGGFSYGSDGGTIFKMNADGTGLEVLHCFAGGTSDGASPQDSLTLSGTTLYGMTFNGGTDDYGTIFKINTDGTGFELLHSFAGGTSDGKDPYGSLTLSGTALYGMTWDGGSSDCGTIFKINTDGTGFELLHSFAGGTSDGEAPHGSLTLSETTLYGTTDWGGSRNHGTIFKINTDGTGYELLHNFAGGASDGSLPYGGSLTLSDGTLYGMTHLGGTNEEGTIFRISTDGTGFQLLHSFAGGLSDGENPTYNSLTLAGTTLYGVVAYGGSSDCGTIFKINTDGTDYELLHSFAGGTSDGDSAYGSLTFSGTTLYGTTQDGGSSNWGTIFTINTDGTGFELLHSFAGPLLEGMYPYGDLTLDNSTLYGTTVYGGLGDVGTIFKLSTDGTGFQLLHSFAGGTSDGVYPKGSLTLSGTTLYGTTQWGGSSDCGTTFKINTDGTGFELLHSFTGATSDGDSPQGTLTLSGTTLYGTTQWGGSSDCGTIFKISTEGTGFQILHSFAGATSDGDCPEGTLTLSGTTLYGTTLQGGSTNDGTIFKINTDGTGYELLHSFAGGASDGDLPNRILTLSGTALYGTTLRGGSSNCGTIFKISTDGTDFQILHSFASGASDGAYPEGGLTPSGAALYGTTQSGGSSDDGTIFRINIDGTGFELVHSFSGSSDGAYPEGSLVGVAFYGMASEGGSWGYGTIFSLTGYTLVDLVSFEAVGTSGERVNLTWETASELDNAGFHLWRGERQDGFYARITDAMIPAEGGPAWGAEYLYEDWDVAPGRTYFYQLEDIDTAGMKTFHGPVSAWPGVANIQAGDRDDLATAAGDQPVSVKVAVQAGDYAGTPVEYWLAADTPFGWYTYGAQGWKPGITPAAVGPLNDVAPLEMVNFPLPPGWYTFYLAVDDQINGQPDLTWMDAVEVVVK